MFIHSGADADVWSQTKQIIIARSSMKSKLLALKMSGIKIE